MSDYSFDPACEAAGRVVGSAVKTGCQEIGYALKAGWTGTLALLRGMKNAQPREICPRQQLQSDQRGETVRSPRSVGQRDQDYVDINNEVCLEQGLRREGRWPYVEQE